MSAQVQSDDVQDTQSNRLAQSIVVVVSAAAAAAAAAAAVLIWSNTRRVKSTSIDGKRVLCER